MARVSAIQGRVVGPAYCDLPFSLTKSELKALKALKGYPTFWWWRRGTDNSGAKPGKTEGSVPLESAPSTNQLSKIRCAGPRAEEATKCYVEDRVMRFRSTLLHTCIETAAAV